MRIHPRASFLSILLLSITLVQPSAAQTEESTDDVKTSLVPAGETATATGVEPPDGIWMVDEAGREFFIDKYPKVEGSYRWVDEEKGIVRLRHLMPLEVYSHDDEFFYFKFIRTKPTEISAADEASEPALPLEVALEEVDTLVLEAADKGLPKQQQWRNGFVFADMNGDGHLDLVHGPARKAFTSPAIFLGDGEGNWSGWADAVYPPAPYDYGDVAVADFNGDGHQDMALAIHLTGFVVLTGDGAGRFELWGEGLPLIEVVERKSLPGQPKRNPKRTPPSFSSRAMIATDWTGDGRPDLIALAEGPGSPEHIAEGKLAESGRVLFENLGDGKWATHSDSASFMGDHIELADIDGDGRQDFVTDSLVVGDYPLINLADPESKLWRSEQMPLERRRPVVRGVTVADFDGDGRPDLAMSVRDAAEGKLRQAIDLYLKRDDGYEHRVLVSTVDELVNFRSLTTADLDSDGDQDLVALLSEGHTWLLLNDGKAGFVREVSPELEARGGHKYCAGYRVRALDLDGDGQLELAANFAGEPGSEALFPAVAETRCPARGAIRLWKVRSKSDA